MTDSKLAFDGGKPVRSEPMPARAVFDEAEVRDTLTALKKVETAYLKP